MAGPTGPTKTADRSRGDGGPGSPAAPDSGPPPPVQEARRRLRLPGRRAVLIAAVVTVLLGAFAIWALYGSNWLRVEKVSTDGAKVLTKEEILRAAAVPEGAPVISVDREAAEKRLLAKLPRLAEADVVRAWPHGIGLNVTERKPELVLEKAGKYVEVDAGGVRFATTPTRPKGVPLLVMDLQESSGTGYFGAKRLRREAVQVASALPGEVASATRMIRIRSYDSITLDLSGGRTVQWGSSERGASKAAALSAVMKASKEAEHFDVSVPSAPAASGS